MTEAVDPFTVDGSGYATSTLTYDGSGNLTFDGLQKYTYDAWNRLKTVAHAYDDGSVQAGQAFATMSYDAAGRRIMKAINHTDVNDCTYHYYLSGNSVVEEQNGTAKATGSALNQTARPRPTLRPPAN